MNRDIRIVSEEQCTGCGACENICPMDAVELKEGKEGFLYPVIQTSRCIQCGKMQGGLSRAEKKQIPTAESPNAEPLMERIKSGVKVLREQSLPCFRNMYWKRGGAVYGVVLDEQFQAIHVRVTRKEGACTSPPFQVCSE